MKPGWIVVIAIVGFALLAAAGFWAIHATTPPGPPAPAPAPSDAGVPPRPVHLPPPRLLPVPRDAGVSARDAGAIPSRAGAYQEHEVLPRERFTLQADPVRALEPLVQDCFADAATHDPGPLTATLRFRPTPDGRLTGGQLVRLSVTDPMLQACLEDSILDARLQPGIGGTSTEHTFEFAGPAR
jgi:hypothetical protein